MKTVFTLLIAVCGLSNGLPSFTVPPDHHQRMVPPSRLVQLFWRGPDGVSYPAGRLKDTLFDAECTPQVTVLGDTRCAPAAAYAMPAYADSDCTVLIGAVPPGDRYVTVTTTQGVDVFITDGPAYAGSLWFLYGGTGPCVSGMPLSYDEHWHYLVHSITAELVPMQQVWQ